MVRRLKRIAPLQFGKILGVAYGIMGLIFIPFFLLMSMVGMLAPHRAGSPSAALPAIFGLGFALLMPVFYSIFGFVFGVVGAWIYNLIAKWIGGIEVEVE